jgi:hypothetical protein
MLAAKFLHYGITQNIGIEFAGSCKFDNFLGDHFIGKIAAVSQSKSKTSHFERETHDASGLGIEFGIAQKLRDRHDDLPLLAGEPDGFGPDIRDPPNWYVARWLGQVQLGTRPMNA